MPTGYDIKRNSARCAKCGDEIESTHVHDFKSCKCGAIAVDGGREYLKRSCDHPSDIIETSQIEKWSDERITQWRTRNLNAYDWYDEDFINRTLALNLAEYEAIRQQTDTER